MIGQTLGSYSYRKRGTTFVVAVFLMEVVAEQATWPEMRWRQRRWCTLDEAVTLLSAHPGTAAAHRGAREDTECPGWRLT